jgi:Transposase DDE domain
MLRGLTPNTVRLALCLSKILFLPLRILYTVRILGPMAGKRRLPVVERDLQGLKYFKVLGPLLDGLHDAATARDRAGNRQLHYDQFALLLLLYFFNPIVSSLRGIQQASSLGKVQKLLGCERAALGSLSEASRVFDAELLRPLLGELAAQALPLMVGREAEALRGLTAVDGSLLPALPKMAWALFQDDQHRAAKMHVHFDVLKGVPVEVTVTPGNDPEQLQLRQQLQPERLYVIDRGYAVYQLFQDIIDGGSSFIGRVRDDAAFAVLDERPLTDEDRAAGVVRDAVVRLGADSRAKALQQPVRLVWVATGKSRADGSPEVLLLATSRLDLTAELVALGYKHRWSVELFFRWFKCILGCRHLLSTSSNGVTMQVYLGIIASLLISLWTGKKPTLRTFEMLQWYFSGMATEEELRAHIEGLKKHDS